MRLRYTEVCPCRIAVRSARGSIGEGEEAPSDVTSNTLLVGLVSVKAQTSAEIKTETHPTMHRLV